VSETYEGVGLITNVYGNNNYTVQIETGEGLEARDVLCYMSGRMCRHRIKVIEGDEVMVRVSPPYDRGVITFRGRKEAQPPSEGRNKGRKKGRGRGRRR
jgi:translation initiation factor IF-1